MADIKITEKLARDIMRRMGSRGGTARRKKLTDAQLSDSSSNAAQARWAKWRAENGKPPKPGDEKYLPPTK